MAHLSEKQRQILRQLRASRIDEDQNGRKQGGIFTVRRSSPLPQSEPVN
jgi:hypothetical protein